MNGSSLGARLMSSRGLDHVMWHDPYSPERKYEFNKGPRHSTSLTIPEPKWCLRKAGTMLAGTLEESNTLDQALGLDVMDSAARPCRLFLPGGV